MAQVTLPNTPPKPNPLPQSAYIIAGGPSLTNFKWDRLDNLFTIAINRAYEVVPTADIVYFTDEDYYKTHLDDMLKHSGRLLKGCVNKAGKYHKRIERVDIKAGKGLSNPRTAIHHGRNSTFAALDLAIRWGIKTIYLLGVDMKWDKNKSHWHSGHKRIDGEAALKGFMTPYKEAAPMIKRQGVEVININNNTSLNVFPIIKYEEHFGENCFS